MGLEGALLLQREAHADDRGMFDVVWSREEMSAAGVGAEFVQDNLIKTRRGTLRGMHFQSRKPQGKLCTVLEGEVYEAAVDLRPDSPTFGRWEGLVLRAEENRSLWLPPGFAHGFLVLSDTAEFVYKCTDYYAHGDEYGIRWNDPEIAIDWPTEGLPPLLSEKDEAAPCLEDAKLFP